MVLTLAGKIQEVPSPPHTIQEKMVMKKRREGVMKKKRQLSSVKDFIPNAASLWKSFPFDSLPRKNNSPNKRILREERERKKREHEWKCYEKDFSKGLGQQNSSTPKSE